jgi:short-subunit dehydrogenase
MNERRVLAVTGASAGIGAALAIRAARAGYAVVATGRNADALTLLAQRVTSEGGSITTLIGDVRSSLTSERIAATALEVYGRLDVLVANAGIAGRGPLAVQSDEELREQFETHVYAPITLIRACLPLLTASKGTTFVLGSGVARMPIGGMGLYPASKAALRSASRTLRNELKPLGIGLTYVDPGAVDTEFMHRQSMPGAPRLLLTSPHTVAKQILAAISRRPNEVNVVAWQTALLGLAEMAPRLTDYILAHAGAITGAPVTHVALSRNDAITRLRSEVTIVQTALTDQVPDANDPTASTKIPSTSERQTSPTTASTPPHVDYAAWKAGNGSSAANNGANGSPVRPSAAASINKAKVVEPTTTKTPIETPPTTSVATAVPVISAVPEPSTKPKPSTNVPEAAPSVAETAKAESAPTQESTPAAPARPRATSRMPKFTPDDDAITIVTAPFVSRMRRLSFPPDMLRLKLELGNPFSEDEIALDWVGMPNKNERKLITDMCNACAEIGMLASTGERQWSVLTITPDIKATDSVE